MNKEMRIHVGGATTALRLKLPLVSQRLPSAPPTSTTAGSKKGEDTGKQES